MQEDYGRFRPDTFYDNEVKYYKRAEVEPKGGRRRKSKGRKTRSKRRKSKRRKTRRRK